MGCDIHAVLEGPHHFEDCGWVSLGDVPIERHYAAFAALGNVRQRKPEVPYIGDSRFIGAAWDGEDQASCPTSAHFWQVLRRWGVDGHSPSFATLPEMSQHPILAELYARCYAIARAHGKEPAKCRLVFVFDN